MSLTLASDTLRQGPQSPVHRFVLYLLAGNADHDGELNLSVAELSALSGITCTRRVQRILGRLETDGWITRVPRYGPDGAQLPNRIRVTLSPRSEMGCNPPGDGSTTRRVGGGDSFVTGGGDNIVTGGVTVLSPPPPSHSRENGAKVGQNGQEMGQNGLEVGWISEQPFGNSEGGPIYIYSSSSREKREEEEKYIEGGMGGDQTAAEAAPGWWRAWRAQVLEEKSRADLVKRHLGNVIDFLEKPAQARKPPEWAKPWMVSKLEAEWPEAAANPRFMAAYMAWFLFRRSLGGKSAKLTEFMWSQFPDLRDAVAGYESPVLEAAGWLYLGIAKGWQGVPRAHWVASELASRNGRGQTARTQTQMAPPQVEWNEFLEAMRGYGQRDLAPQYAHALAALQTYWTGRGGRGDVAFALAERADEFAPLVQAAVLEFAGHNSR